MQAFSFDSVPTVRCEWGAAARLGALLAGRFAERRALLVTDAFLRETGLIAPALASLEAAGFTVRIFDAVVPDPPESVLAA